MPYRERVSSEYIRTAKTQLPLYIRTIRVFAVFDSVRIVYIEVLNKYVMRTVTAGGLITKTRLFKYIENFSTKN